MENSYSNLIFDYIINLNRPIIDKETRAKALHYSTMAFKLVQLQSIFNYVLTEILEIHF